jgi:hypothetical protein
VSEGTDKSLECLYSGVVSLPCLHTKITLRVCLTSDKMMAPLMTKRLGQFRVEGILRMPHHGKCTISHFQYSSLSMHIEHLEMLIKKGEFNGSVEL